MGKRFDQPLIPVKGPSKAKPGQQGEQPKAPPPPSAPRQKQRTPSGNRRGG
jgi:hypothetical protein